MTLEAWPGPMEGVFSPAFLMAAKNLQLSRRWMTAFFRISENCPRQKFFDQFLAHYPREQELVGQLMGNDPELLAAAAEKMVAAGATSLNLNYGCPAKRVISSGAGGGILRTFDRGIAVARQVIERVPQIPVSVKLRCGFADFSEIEQWLPALTAVGVSKFFIHYRTVKEGYLPVAPDERLRRFDRIAALSALPWVLNGDLKSAAEARTLAVRFGACGVMLARYWLPDPYVLRRLEGEDNLPPPAEGQQRFLQEVAACGLTGGALIGVRRMCELPGAIKAV